MLSSSIRRIRLGLPRTPKPPPRTVAIAAIVALMVGLVVFPARSAHAMASGPNSPTAAADISGYTAWTNVTWVEAHDSTVASVTLASGARSDDIEATGYGFNLPTGATISGVTVDMYRYANPGADESVEDNTVSLIVGGVLTGSNLATATAWPTTETDATYGSSSTLWGTTLTASQINAANFGVDVAAKDVHTGGKSNSSAAYIDYIAVTVNYTVPYTLTQAAYQFYNNATPPGSDSQGASWNTLTASGAFAGTPRTEAGAATLNGTMYTMGGFNPGTGTIYDDVYQSTDGVTWTQDTASAWSGTGRTGMAVLVFDNKLWVLGGEINASTGGTTADVWYSLDGKTWTLATSTPGWAARSNFAAFVLGGTMYIAGGSNSTGAYLNDVWSSTDGITWTQVTTSGSLWAPRSGMGYAVLNNKMWLYGGYDTLNHYNDVWYSTDGATWTEATPSGCTTACTGSFTGRRLFGSLAYDNMLWVLGGTDDANSFNDVWCSTNGATWSDSTAGSPACGTTAAAWSGRFGLDALIFNDSLVVIGGGTLSYTTYDDAYQSPLPAMDVGSSLAAANTPATSLGDGVTFHLRLDIAVTGANLPAAAQSFELEYAALAGGSCSATTGFAAVTASTPVRYSSITPGVNGQTITTTAPADGTNTLVDQEYLQSGTTTFDDPTAVPVGEDGVWDFALTTYDIAAGQSYCLRLANADGTPINAYTYLPEITTPASTVGQSHYRFYANQDGPAAGWANGTWPRSDSASSLSFGGKLWYIGGFYSQNNTDSNQVWYSTDGSTWTAATLNAPWAARRNLTALVFNNEMWVMGGTGTAGDLNDVWYSADGTNWTEATASAAWSIRDSAAGAVYNNEMWIMGGEMGVAHYNDVWYSTDGITWTEATASAAWSARSGLNALVYNNALWVMAGGTLSTQFNDVWSSTDGITWNEATASAGWSARDTAAAMVLGSDMWIVGGYDQSTTYTDYDAWYSTDGKTWTEATSAAPWSSGSLMAYAVYNNAMYVMGGTDEWDGYTDVFSSADGVTWTKVTHNPPWAGRWDASVLSFNNKLYIMGGSNGSTYLNDVWSSTDGVTWTQATASAGWAARSQAAAVVFNNEMWIMGGVGAANYGDAWYSTDGVTWTQATAGTNASTALTRSGAAALVYNNQLWLMGGYNAGNLSDVWTSTDGSNWTEATTAAPWGPRAYAGATVANNKMYVMGGTDGTNADHDVWTSTDGTNWTEVTAAASWGGRENFAAVTYNNKLYVMGGYDRQLSGTSAYYSDMWTSTDGYTWTQQASPPWANRMGMATTVFANRIWLLGGYNASAATTYFDYQDAWSYAPGPDVGAPLANQDRALDAFGTQTTAPAPVTAVPIDQPFRLRWLIAIGGSAQPENNLSLDLQYAPMSASSCAATPAAGYSNVTSSTPVQFYTGNTVATGGMGLMPDAADPTDGTTTINYQTYVSANPFTNSQSDIPGNQDGLWDFALQLTASPPHGGYCLRVVYSATGATIDSYNIFPQIDVAPLTSQLLRGREWWNSSGVRQFKDLR